MNGSPTSDRLGSPSQPPSDSALDETPSASLLASQGEGSDSDDAEAGGVNSTARRSPSAEGSGESNPTANPTADSPRRAFRFSQRTEPKWRRRR